MLRAGNKRKAEQRLQHGPSTIACQGPLALKWGQGAGSRRQDGLALWPLREPRLACCITWHVSSPSHSASHTTLQRLQSVGPNQPSVHQAFVNHASLSLSGPLQNPLSQGPNNSSDIPFTCPSQLGHGTQGLIAHSIPASVSSYECASQSLTSPSLASLSFVTCFGWLSRPSSRLDDPLLQHATSVWSCQGVECASRSATCMHGAMKLICITSDSPTCYRTCAY